MIARFASFDGAQIAYEVVGEEQGASAVLLHHGFASDIRTNWERPGLIAALVGAGRRVVALDARGHGHSDHPHDPAAYAGHAMARDVTALIDHLGLEAVDMAGYSMGAFVTLETAAREPRLRRLFLGGTGPGQQRTPEWRASIAAALEAESPRQVRGVTERAFRAFADATGQDRRALAAIQRATEPLDLDAVRAIRLPTVVVNGVRDDLAAGPFQIADLIDGARYLVVPGNHLSAVTKPEFAAALVEWARS